MFALSRRNCYQYPSTRGCPPSPRCGSAACVVGHRVFLFGGRCKQRRLNEGAQRPKRLLKMLKTPRTLRLNTFKKNWNWTCLILLTASFHEFSKVNE